MGKADEEFTTLSALAEKLKLEGDEKDSFIDSAMKRLGFKARTAWDDPDPNEGDKGSGDFFSRGKPAGDKNNGGGQYS